MIMTNYVFKRLYFRVNFDGNLEIMNDKDWEEEVIRFVNCKVLHLVREFGMSYNYRKFYDIDNNLLYIERVSKL